MKDDIESEDESLRALKKSKTRRTLYVYMFFLLLLVAAVFIIYNYQNMTFSVIKDPDDPTKTKKIKWNHPFF